MNNAHPLHRPTAASCLAVICITPIHHPVCLSPVLQRRTIPNCASRALNQSRPIANQYRQPQEAHPEQINRIADLEKKEQDKQQVNRDEIKKVFEEMKGDAASKPSTPPWMREENLTFFSKYPPAIETSLGLDGESPSQSQPQRAPSPQLAGFNLAGQANGSVKRRGRSVSPLSRVGL